MRQPGQDERVPEPPVFVGGTGRSGTTVTAKLIAAHPAYAMIPVEVRFISHPGGLCDLARGRTWLWRFRQRMRGPWFLRGQDQGLNRILDRATIDAALEDLRSDLRGDRWVACARFAHRLLDPLAVAAGARGWVEMTPGNVLAAPDLLRMFPGSHLVHSVRDGRDVACSVVPLSWGPSDVDEALDWWAAKLERAFVACEGLPADQVHELQLEDLVHRDRASQYASLASFLGQDDPAMAQYFHDHVTDDRAHFGRWLDDVPAGRLPAFEVHHAALADKLIARGRAYRPITEADLGGRVGAPQPARVD
jgi:hypothetical protein